MHAHHAEKQFIAARHRAKPHHCADNRNAQLLRKLQHLVRRVGEKHAAAHADYGFFTVRQRLCHPLDLAAVSLHRRLISPDRNRFRIVELQFFVLNVNRNVDQHRTRAAAACNYKRLFENPRDVRGVFYNIAVLRKRLGRARDIGLLEHVPSQLLRADLPGDCNDRYGIHIRRCKRRNQVGRARPGGRNADGRAAAHARIAACGMSRVLFLPDQDMPYIRVGKRIIKRADRRARIAEYILDTFVLKTFYHRLRTGYHAACPLYHILIVRRFILSVFG